MTSATPVVSTSPQLAAAWQLFYPAPAVLTVAARAALKSTAAERRLPLGLEPVEVPIACNLSAEDAGSQLDEWSQLLAEFPASRVSRSQLVVRIGGSPATVAAVIALAQREKACCPFFDFSLQVGRRCRASCLSP